MVQSKLIFFLLLLLSINVWSQNNRMDSLLTIVNQQKGDTTEVKILVSIANEHTNADSAFKYIQRGLMLSEKLNYKKGKADCLLVLSIIFSRQMNLSSVIQFALAALNLYEETQDVTGIVNSHGILQAAYRNVGDYQNSLLHVFSGQKIAEKNEVRGTFLFAGQRQSPLFLAETAQIYLLKNQLDSAIYYTKKAIDQNELFNGSKWNFPIYLLATIETKQGNYQSALAHYRSALPLAVKNGFFHDTLQIFAGMSMLFLNIGAFDSAIYYAKMVESSKNPEKEIQVLLDAVNTLKQSYKMKQNKDSILKYTELSYFLKDSLLGKEKDREIQGFSFKEKLKEQEFIAAQEKYKSKGQLYVLVTGLLILLLVAAILWRNNLQKQRAKAKIERAYIELKNTQVQLIQSEKMASLGELTAGIAHEIQNPLNFVNNFSDVNTELLLEMKDEIDKGNMNEVKLLADDLIGNQEKINQHGKRADAIVKGMLQHSRSSSGVKEPTDINALADEYLRLSFHGLRAKDKSFNATMETHFDENLQKIAVIPQDIGRVLLNLYNNAFYAVSEKKKLQGDNYEPAVSVSTKRIGNKTDSYRVEISVKDNGMGIPQKVLDKIFQPFFTTKPTGQGTGLGLSLSYDIIKAHGGEIKVETKDGEGAEFIISLPV